LNIEFLYINFIFLKGKKNVKNERKGKLKN